MTKDRASANETLNSLAANAALNHLSDAVGKAVESIRRAVRGGGKILVAGNGGSCADALHFSGELLKSFLFPRPLAEPVAAALRNHAFGEELISVLEAGLPVVVLGQNPSLSSAYLNDKGAAKALFAQECLALAKPDDVLVVFSTSGESENILWAMATMRAIGGLTIAFTGKTGGRIGRAADVEIRSPSSLTPQVQEHHVVLYHALAARVEEEFFG